MFKRISVFGLGYIGLPTAAILASRKVEVIGVDVDPTIVETINQGQIHLVEPELDIIVHSVVSEGYLRAVLAPEPADAFLIAVPTPLREGHKPDVTYIQAAARAIAPVLKQGDLVVLESTSPVGTTEQLIELFVTLRPDLIFPTQDGEKADIRVAYCPERVLPGHILRELVQNDRVIGGVTPACSEKAKQLYQLFVEGECIETNTRTAEMCKLTENSYRDVNIAFANELSIICDKLAIDVRELTHLANRHPRVNILQSGPGVGGHCIAVDPWFIVSSVPEEARLIEMARQVNDAKPHWVVQKIQRECDILLQRYSEKSPRDISIVCLGLTFKPDTDDLRGSPALQVVTELGNCHPGPLFVVEPHISSLPNVLSGSADLIDMDSALLEADIVVRLVSHKMFKFLVQDVSDARYCLIDVCAD
ncbi:MAG: UDP-N-acetyl-D-mannosamine dehydrogenase [Legionellaceae bacterium]|nr:UDP-N-acetyl-D-mannosamine dehydrogenase [Legionellaceae bacterium]